MCGVNHQDSSLFWHIIFHGGILVKLVNKSHNILSNHTDYFPLRLAEREHFVQGWKTTLILHCSET